MPTASTHGNCSVAGSRTSATTTTQPSKAGPVARDASRTSAIGVYCRCFSSSSTYLPIYPADNVRFVLLLQPYSWGSGMQHLSRRACNRASDFMRRGVDRAPVAPATTTRRRFVGAGLDMELQRDQPTRGQGRRSRNDLLFGVHPAQMITQLGPQGGACMVWI